MSSLYFLISSHISKKIRIEYLRKILEGSYFKSNDFSQINVQMSKCLIIWSLRTIISRVSTQSQYWEIILPVLCLFAQFNSFYVIVSWVGCNMWTIFLENLYHLKFVYIFSNVSLKRMKINIISFFNHNYWILNF